MTITFYTDGGSRGNPGPAGAGAYIKYGKKTIKLKKYLGTKTNNQAEYLALIIALKKLRSIAKNSDVLKGFLDSKLIIEQLNGNFKVKNPNMKPLFNEVNKILEDLPKTTFTHVPREKNKIADALVNIALDKNEKKGNTSKLRIHLT